MKKTKKSAVGTSFHNTVIHATVNQLISICGEPDFSDNDGEDKVNFSWDMETETGNVVTIYDWKEYRPISKDEFIEWHIGGKSKSVTENALMEIITAMQQQKNSEVKYTAEHPQEQVSNDSEGVESLEDAAKKHSDVMDSSFYDNEIPEHIIKEWAENDFKAGAKWQQKQMQPLLDFLNEVANFNPDGNPIMLIKKAQTLTK